jgi:hypothetical protein
MVGQAVEIDVAQAVFEAFEELFDLGAIDVEFELEVDALVFLGFPELRVFAGRSIVVIEAEPFHAAIGTDREALDTDRAFPAWFCRVGLVCRAGVVVVVVFADFLSDSGRVLSGLVGFSVWVFVSGRLERHAQHGQARQCRNVVFHGR